MTTMSAAQLIIMAAVVVALMAVWLTLVFLADREPRRGPTGTSPGSRAGAASMEGTALVPPPRRPGDEEAAPAEPGKALRSGIASRA